jgi:hypothetical protein
VSAEGVWCPVVGVCYSGTCCRLFTEAFSEEISLKYSLFAERERFEVTASLHSNIGGNGGGGLVSSGRSFLLGNLLPTFF